MSCFDLRYLQSLANFHIVNVGGGGVVQMQVCEVFNYFISIFSINFNLEYLKY